MWNLLFNKNKKNLPNYFSYSQINSYKLCPQQYKLLYIDGIRKEYESIESCMGKRVHSVLEWLYKPENKEIYINFDRIVKEYDRYWIDNWHSKIFVVSTKFSRKEKKYLYQHLTEKQLNYCAKDVIYLHEIYNGLMKILLREKRDRLYKEAIKFIHSRVDLDLASFTTDIWSH